MQFFPLILQIALLVGWYAVPAMASVPALVIFLPLMLMGTGLFLMLVFFALAAVIAWRTN